MSNFTPFTAYFEYSFDDSIDKLHDIEFLPIYLGRSSENSENVSVSKFLKYYLTGSNLPIFKKESIIPFDFHSLHSIFPNTIKKDDLKAKISFKIKSEEIEVIQIIKEEITFVLNNKKVKTIAVDKNTELIKV